MTETIRYSKIGQEDIAFGSSGAKFEVTLADGRVVLMSQVDLAVILADPVLSSLLTLQRYTLASRPANDPAKPGRLLYQTDGVAGIYYDTGTAWSLLSASGAVLNSRRINTSTGLTGGGDLSGDLTFSWLGLPVRKGGSAIGTRGNLNLIEGTNITLTVADNSGTDSVDVTIAATSGGGTVMPAGAMVDYAAGSAPSGWLLCDGSAVSRTTYIGLFAAISTTWGVGDGSTTFNVPDFRGRVSVGTGTGSGLTARTLAANGGEETHVLVTAELAAHTHGAGSYSGAQTASGFGGGVGDAQTVAAAGGAISGTSGSTGSGTAHNNMQPFRVATKIIKT